MAAKEKLNSFEAMLDRLQRIADQLEQGTVPLDEALALYEEGVALAKQCADRLSKAETTVKELSRTADGLFDVRPVDENE